MFQFSTVSSTDDPQRSHQDPRSRRRGAGVVAGLVLAVGLVAGTAAPVAAADNDPRIYASAPQCLSGVWPEVRVMQPFVYGNRSTPEKIWWKPFLQRYDARSGWVYVLQSTEWLTFSATNQGSYDPFAYPHDFIFSLTQPGDRYAYYRVVNLVFWGSTGEYGTKVSSYCYLS